MSTFSQFTYWAERFFGMLSVGTLGSKKPNFQNGLQIAGVEWTTLGGAETVTTGITAFAGGGQASAVALTTRFNNVTVCATAGDSVKLLTAAAGTMQTVKNSGATALDVFPFSGDSINAMAANLAVRIPVNGILTFRAISSSAWETEEVITLPSPSTVSGSFNFKSADNAGNYAVILQNASHGQSSTYNLNDAGGATGYVPTTTIAAVGAGLERASNYWIPEALKTLFADANACVRHAVPQTVDMADAELVLTAVVGAPAGTLLTSNILYVDPNSTGTTEKLRLPPVGDVGGIMLYIHNIGGENISVADDGGVVLNYLPPDRGAVFYSNNTAWQGFIGRTTTTFNYPVLPNELTDIDGARITVTPAAGAWNLKAGYEGGTIEGEVASGIVVKTDTSYFMFKVPDTYVAGQSFIIHCRAKKVGAGTCTATVDMQVSVVGSDGIPGADICATSAIAVSTTSFVDKDFTITPTTILAGSILAVSIVGVVDLTAGADTNLELTNIEVRCTASV